MSTAAEFALTVEVYLDGVATGAASVYAARFPEFSTDERDRLSHAVVDALRGDPLAMAAVEEQIVERLVGVDSGPKDITTYGGEVDG